MYGRAIRQGSDHSYAERTQDGFRVERRPSVATPLAQIPRQTFPVRQSQPCV